MQFVDTSSTDAKDTLAVWLKEACKDGVSGIYIQTGYLADGSFNFLANATPTATLQNCEVRVVIGSNEPRTYAPDIEKVIDFLHVPRDQAKLGIVAFGEGLFHPKCYVITRIDGSMTAYVGSANLTPSGLAKNIEAGIIIDTRDTSSAKTVCKKIVGTISDWFGRGESEGFYLITKKDDVKKLVKHGILSAIPAPPRSSSNASTTAGPGAMKLPRLKPLVNLPKYPLHAPLEKNAVQQVSPISHSTSALKKAGKPIIGSILVAEVTLGRSGRSRQIDVNKDAAETYFGGVGTQLTCIPVSREGVVGTAEFRTVGTKSSDNYYIELSGLNGTFKGPNYRERPLLLMAKYPANQSRYLFFWLYPDDPMFDDVYDDVIAPKIPGRKGKNSIKLVKPYVSLMSVWSDNPFELARLKEEK